MRAKARNTTSRKYFFQDSLPDAEGGMHCINFYLECRCQGQVRLNEESSQYAWIGPDELASYHLAFRNDEGLLLYWKHACQS